MYFIVAQHKNRHSKHVYEWCSRYDSAYNIQLQTKSGYENIVHSVELDKLLEKSVKLREYKIPGISSQSRIVLLLQRKKAQNRTRIIGLNGLG